MNDYSKHERHGLSDWLFSRTGAVTALAIAILAFLIYTGHSAHLLGALPFLLILACPLMHIFMHGGHRHSHDSHGTETDTDKQDENSVQHKH